MKQSPKRILISHVYSRDNKGDAALTSVLISDLKSKFPGAKLDILALQPGKDSFEGVPEHANFMQYVLGNVYHPLRKLWRATYMVSATMVWAWWFRHTGLRLYLPKPLEGVAELYAAADLIVPVGGGHIRSQKGLLGLCNVPLLLHPLLFAYLLGKPTILYSQSIGPFRTRLEERLVALAFRRMTLLLLREDTSVALLARLGVTHNVVRSIDSGFLLHTPHKLDLHKTYHIPAGKLIVGVTVRSWLSGNSQVAYERAVAEALDDLVEHFGAHILFIPQVTAAKGDDDRVVSRRVHWYMKHASAATVINNQPDHYHIKAIYDGLDALLGTRFHSVIFSLTSYVPVLAIEYEHKTSGIMHDLGLDKWVIKIEDAVATELMAALHDLLQHRDQYQAYLHKHIPPYVQKARQTISHVADSYDSLAGNS